MGRVIHFLTKDATGVDVITALDAAICDLKDISKQCQGDAKDEAEACLRILKVARRDARFFFGQGNSRKN